MKIALFATCIVDAMVPSAAIATTRILRRLGHEVTFPAGQGCCGQMHINSGYFADVVPVVRNHVKAFEGAEYIVAPSGSCVASARHQQAMVARRAGDSGLEQAAVDTGERTYELSQFLVDVLGITNAAELGSYFPHSVTYHPSCHGKRLLRLGDRQVDLVRSVEGIEFTELPDAAECCGFGGTFSLKNPDVSGAMAEAKIANIERSGADICTGGDASCLFHLQGAMLKRGVDKRTLHFAEILAATKEQPWSI